MFSTIVLKLTEAEASCMVSLELVQGRTACVALEEVLEEVLARFVAPSWRLWMEMYAW